MALRRASLKINKKEGGIYEEYLKATGSTLYINQSKDDFPYMSDVMGALGSCDSLSEILDSFIFHLWLQLLNASTFYYILYRIEIWRFRCSPPVDIVSVKECDCQLKSVFQVVDLHKVVTLLVYFMQK